MNMTINDKLAQAIDIRTEKFNSYIQISEDSDTPYVILESCEELDALNAQLNGFEGLKGSTHYLREDDTTLEAKLLRLEQEVLADPSHYNVRTIKELKSHIEYQKFLAANNILEPVEADTLGAEIVFSDEYCLCNDCRKSVRTSPDSYSWVAPMFLDDVGYVCEDCCMSYSDEMLEAYKNSPKAIPTCFNLENLGLVKINEDGLANGLFEGQNDDPKAIIELLNDLGVDVWFEVQPCQFSCSFDVYIKEADLDLVTSNVDRIESSEIAKRD